MSTPKLSRRQFVERMPYVAPAVLTLTAAPEYAKAGSAKPNSSGGGWQKPNRGKTIDLSRSQDKGKSGVSGGKVKSDRLSAKGKDNKGPNGSAVGQAGTNAQGPITQDKSRKGFKAAGSARSASDPEPWDS